MRLPYRPVLSLLGLSLLALGCTDDASDARDDDFLVDGKSDSGGIAEGSPEAAAVLEVANTTSRADLVGEAGVAAKAADNIIAVRDGDDGNAGTADDARFDTLAELDAVPFVGPIAFGKLLQYARDNDLVGDSPAASNDPFDPTACAGAPMTMAAAKARWNAGHAELGSYQLTIRTRTCVNGTCPAWSPYPVSSLEWPQDASGVLKLGNYNGEIRVLTEARLCDAILSNRQYVVGGVCDGVGHELQCSTYNEPDECRTPQEIGLRANNGSYFRFTGKLADSCVQLISKTQRQSSLDPNKVFETEAAILERF